MESVQLKILVVEDNPADRALFRAYLKHIDGVEFRDAEFGSIGLELCRSWEPDCILLDFTLPDMTGIEFIDLLREGGAGLPCALVMLTGISDERVAVRAVKAGATDYVPKSENMESVLEHSIYRAIDKHRLEKELERNRVELARSEHLHRSLMKALPQLVFTADSDCRITFGNEQWWEYTGAPEGRRASFDCNEALHPDERRRWWRNWRDRTAGAANFDLEIRLKRARDQQFRWHLVRAVSLGGLSGPAGVAGDWLATCTDIEDQKRAEQAMVQRQKWDSIGLLAGGIAHDFNNLLVGILGGASYVADALPASHPTQPVLQNVVTSGERAAHLTRQLLAYAGKGVFFVQQVDLSPLVEQTCELIRSSVPNNVQVMVQTTAGLPSIETDSGQVQQVVMNLVLNAVEAVPPTQSGLVFVRTFLDTRGPDGDFVTVEVRDNGRGMDPETQARIFDPFFTTKFTGRGLGLAAVQGILRSTGAVVDVTSAPGKGSKFTVRFRASAAKANGGAENAAPPSGIALDGAGRTILVIDDEPAVLRLCKAALERYGFTVLLAESGPKGLEILDEKGARVELLLLDLGMPGMSGRRALEQIRQEGFSMPVIVFSGYSESEATREFAGLNIASFLQKPFVSARLSQAVADVIGERRQTGMRAS